MFTTGEELNVLGLKSWLETVPQEDLDRIRALINADMIGWDGDSDRVMELYYGDEAPSIRLAVRIPTKAGTHSEAFGQVSERSDAGSGQGTRSARIALGITARFPSEHLPGFVRNRCPDSAVLRMP
jgi:hypothetical protein